MPPDLRWLQRFANVCQALDQLETFFSLPRSMSASAPAVEEVWLYGSRAMGRHHAGSDIDLTLVAPGLSHQGRLRLMGALDDLLLPWSIDLSLRHELPESLAQHVARVGRRLAPDRAPPA